MDGGSYGMNKCYVALLCNMISSQLYPSPRFCVLSYYHKRRAEGKAYGTTIGAICRKLLARIFVILRDQRLMNVLV